MNDDAPPHVALWLRLAAIFYDVIAVGAVLFFAAGIVVAAAGKAVAPHNASFTIYLVAVTYAYFAFCWVRGGQTLGMRTWKILLVSDDHDGCITWRQSFIRFCGAIVSWLVCGVGFLAALFDADGRAWHDRWSGSRLVKV